MNIDLSGNDSELEALLKSDDEDILLDGKPESVKKSISKSDILNKISPISDGSGGFQSKLKKLRNELIETDNIDDS